MWGKRNLSSTAGRASLLRKRNVLLDNRQQCADARFHDFRVVALKISNLCVPLGFELAQLDQPRESASGVGQLIRGTGTRSRRRCKLDLSYKVLHVSSDTQTFFWANQRREWIDVGVGPSSIQSKLTAGQARIYKATSRGSIVLYILPYACEWFRL